MSALTFGPKHCRVQIGVFFGYPYRDETDKDGNLTARDRMLISVGVRESYSGRVYYLVVPMFLFMVAWTSPGVYNPRWAKDLTEKSKVVDIWRRKRE